MVQSIETNQISLPLFRSPKKQVNKHRLKPKFTAVQYLTGTPGRMLRGP
jgi:hypothetical protein